MSETSKNATTSGIGFSSLLGLVFIILKLCHVIDWSWWWVLSPFWISAGIGIILLMILIIIVVCINKKE